MERKVDFVSCDMPSANAFMINVYAAVAQEEPHRRCRTFGAWWPARLVAAESEDSLISLANRERRNTASGYFVHEPEQISLTPIWRRRRAFLRTSTKEY
jgi:hypothetical protein